jgi:integrase/recombinase XerD
MVSQEEYTRLIEKALTDSRISKANLQILKKYDNHGKLQQLTPGTRNARLTTLRQLALFVKKNFNNMTKEDLENYVISLGDLKSTTFTVKGAFIKSFFKWLCDSDQYPPNVRWIKTTLKKQNRKLPSDLLTKAEIKNMAEVADNLNERALILVLYESACRIGEILNLQIKDVSIDQYGCVIVVNGKTGMRRIRLIESSPDLVLWLNNHPRSKDRDSPLFIYLANQNQNQAYGKGLTHRPTSQILKKLAKRAGISKRVHPHLFRHSRLTELAKDFSESELKIMAGWTGSSNMAEVYVHLSGADIEKKILEKNGLINGNGHDPDKDMLKPKECPRCKEINPNTAKFCYVCSMALDMKSGVELGYIETKEMQTDDALSKELIQYIIKKHPELVLEFLKENGMDSVYSLEANRIQPQSTAALIG